MKNNCQEQLDLNKPRNKRRNQIFMVKKINKYLILSSPYLRTFIDKKEKELSKDTNILDIRGRENNIDSFINKFDIDILLDELILFQSQNITTSNSFNKNYTLFKKTLFFQNVTRKTKIDSVLKKCKAKFVKAFQELLNKLLKDYSIFYRLPRIFISDINIDSNKKYLNSTMLEIYRNFNIEMNFSDIKSILSQKGIALLKSIMNQTYKSLYEEYIHSKRFQYDCRKICKKEGKKFELLFKYVSKIFIDYYSLSKGNKIKHSTDKTDS